MFSPDDSSSASLVAQPSRVKLDVMIVSMAGRMDHLLSAGALPEVEGVRYIVACQDPEHTLPDDYVPPEFSGRADLRFGLFRDRGVTKNRNHALDMSSAPYIYIADDDLEFSADGFRTIILTMERNPELDCALFRADIPEKRVFPPGEADLRKPWRFHSPVNFEIALRLQTVRRYGIRFCELVGIGAPRMGAGEEEMMMASLRKRGCSIRFFPKVIVRHPGNTTSVRNALRSDVIRSKGAVIGSLNTPLGVLLRLPLEAWRSPAPFFRAFRLIADGYLYYLRHIRKSL